MAAATNVDFAARERAIFLDTVSHRRELDLGATAAVAREVRPINPAREIWDAYAEIPLAPPGGLAVNVAPDEGEDPVQLVSMRLTPVAGSALKWERAAAGQPTPDPPALDRVIPAAFGNGTGWAPTLTVAAAAAGSATPPGTVLPTTLYVVDGAGEFVEFPAGSPTGVTALTLRFYRYTGATGGGGGGGGGGDSALFEYVTDAVTEEKIIALGSAAATAAGVNGLVNFVVSTGPQSAEFNDTNATRLLFDVDGAFRAGSADSTQWNATNRGAKSVAFGENNTSSGIRSVVCGGVGSVNRGLNSVVGGGIQNFIHNDDGAGDNCAIMGGVANAVYGNNSAIGTGVSNTIEYPAGSAGIVSGFSNYVSSSFSFIGGGNTNSAGFYNFPAEIDHVGAAVVGGSANRAASTRSFVGCGQNNLVGMVPEEVYFDEPDAAIVCGAMNTCRSQNSFIGGGAGNSVGFGLGDVRMNAQASGIVCGDGNKCHAETSFIGGGSGNTTGISANEDPQFAAENSGIVCGQNNRSRAPGSFVGGGFDNLAGIDEDAEADCSNSGVCAGAKNKSTGSRSFVGSGGYNTASGANSFVGAGGSLASDPEETNAAGNTAAGPSCFVGAGTSNVAGKSVTGNGADASVVAGNSNRAYDTNSFVGGGTGNVVGQAAGTDTGANSAVVGGISNTVTGAQSAILCGSGNAVTANASSILSGDNIVANIANTSYATNLVTFGGRACRIGNVSANTTLQGQFQYVFVNGAGVTISLATPNFGSNDLGQLYVFRAGTSSFVINAGSTNISRASGAGVSGTSVTIAAGGRITLVYSPVEAEWIEF